MSVFTYSEGPFFVNIIGEVESYGVKGPSERVEVDFFVSLDSFYLVSTKIFILKEFNT